MKLLLLKNTYELVTVSLLLVLPLLRTMEQTYSYYAYRKDLPELVVFSVWALIACVFVAPQPMLYWCRKKHPNVRCCIDWFTRTVIEPIIECVFSAMLKKSPNEDGKQDEVYTIFNYKVPEVYKLHLFVVILNLVGVALIQFVDDFVFEESYICNTDPDLACFRKFPKMSTPRLDCSNSSYFEENNITSVICYRFALRLGQATGSALGLVVTTALIFYPINYILIGLSQTLLMKYFKKTRKAPFPCIVHVCLCPAIIPIQILFAFVIVGLAVVLTYYQYQICTTSGQIVTVITKNCCITYTVAYSTIWFPWWSFTKKDEISYEQI